MGKAICGRSEITNSLLVEGFGKNVELWSYKDSVFAAGNHAFFDEGGNYFLMENRPIMYLNYPDTTKMFEIVGDEITYNAITKEAEAFGFVKIIFVSFDKSMTSSKLENCSLEVEGPKVTG